MRLSVFGRLVYIDMVVPTLLLLLLYNVLFSGADSVQSSYPAPPGPMSPALAAV